MARIDILYLDGINSLVASNIFKVNEMMHAENARSPMIGTLEKREGSLDLGTASGGGALAATTNSGLFYFNNNGSPRIYRVSTVGATTSIYYLNGSNVWTALTGGGTNLTSGAKFTYTVGGDNLYLANYSDNTRSISGTDGTTVTDSATTTGNLYNCPKASIINFYKDRLYVADYTYNSVRYKTSVLRSSTPSGIIALVDGDPDSPYTTIQVTDTKYIYTTAPGNTLDVYRGNSKVATLTVTAFSSYKLTCSVSFESGFTSILSADEIWAAGTFGGAKQFRWCYNASSSGTASKDYDSFRLPGDGSESIKMMTNINNTMVISNNNSFAIWNDYILQSHEGNIGCVSKKGWVKCSGGLYFMHYGGVYVSTGGAPKLVSAKVEPYIAGATKAGLESCAAGKKGKSIFFAIGNTTIRNPDGSDYVTLNNVVLEYSVTQENWFVHTGIKATEFATYISATNADTLLYTSAEANYPVTEFLTGSTDNGKEIPFRIDTANIALRKEFENISYVTDVIVEMERGSQLKCFISLDMGNFYEIEGTGIKGLSVFKVTSESGDKTQPVRCRNIRLSFRDYSAQLCKISKVAIIYTPSDEVEMNKPDYIK